MASDNDDNEDNDSEERYAPLLCLISRGMTHRGHRAVAWLELHVCMRAFSLNRPSATRVSIAWCTQRVASSWI